MLASCMTHGAKFKKLSENVRMESERVFFFFFFFLGDFLLYGEHDQMKATNNFPPVACELILNPTPKYEEQVPIFRQKDG